MLRNMLRNILGNILGNNQLSCRTSYSRKVIYENHKSFVRRKFYHRKKTLFMRRKVYYGKKSLVGRQFYYENRVYLLLEGSSGIEKFQYKKEALFWKRAPLSEGLF